ncbi:MAG: LacI family DNA-binding transcriptional regulator [Planctomycetota bacterium]
MPTVRQIAKEAGVSIGTVSRVLNNSPQVSASARDKVLAAANRSGYVGAVGRRSTSNVALLYTGKPSLGSPYDAALMEGMSAGLDRTGSDLIVLTATRARERGESLAQMLLRKSVRAAVVRTTTETRDLVRPLALEPFPFLVIADDFNDPAIPCLSTRVDDACRRAIEHLIHLGHRRIAITLNLLDDHDHAARLDAWRRTLIDHGIDASDRLVHRVFGYRDAGTVALRQLMTTPDAPTAVFCTDPLVGVGMCHEAQRVGVRIPEDLSILGFDDGDQRFSTYPRMSAVCQDAHALGRAAFAVLEQRLGPTTNGQVDVASPECWFEPHESTGPPPASPSH